MIFSTLTLAATEDPRSRRRKVALPLCAAMLSRGQRTLRTRTSPRLQLKGGEETGKWRGFVEASQRKDVKLLAIEVYDCGAGERMSTDARAEGPGGKKGEQSRPSGREGRDGYLMLLVASHRAGRRTGQPRAPASTRTTPVASTGDIRVVSNKGVRRR